MSSTISARHAATVTAAAPTVLTDDEAAARPASGIGAGARLAGKWPIAGFVAGVSAFFFTIFGSKFYEASVTDKGVDGVYDYVKDTGTGQHVAMDLAFLAALALGLFAAGFVRFIASRTPAGSNAASLARLGMGGAVTLTVLIAAFKAIYRGGLPDHMDHQMYTKDAVAVLDVLVGQLQFVALWPLTLVMGAVVALAFRHRTLPRWYGAVTGVILVATLAMAFVLGLPYFAGLVGPIWIIISTIVVLRHRNRPVGVAVV